LKAINEVGNGFLGRQRELVELRDVVILAILTNKTIKKAFAYFIPRRDGVRQSALVDQVVGNPVGMLLIALGVEEAEPEVLRNTMRAEYSGEAINKFFGSREDRFD
jgi:hypothetical protein